MSSDGGGCLPVFDAEGRVASMDVGTPSALADTLRALLRAGQPLERVLPAFTSNQAQLLRLERKGRLVVGADADLVVLDEDGGRGGGAGPRAVARAFGGAGGSGDV